MRTEHRAGALMENRADPL